ncbi:MAG TPA: TonB family protein [Longimicrobiaceae bacterium]|jgi:TonB family protein|nr:TonB family protein [Longimicrobiaceae bacterium]
MIATWMLYCALLSLLAGIGAAGAERVLAAFHLPRRWTWAAAIAISCIVPFTGPQRIRAARGGGVDPAEPFVAAETSPPARTSSTEDASSLWRAVDDGLPMAWMAVSASLVSALALSAGVLARRRRRWTAATVAGRAVLVSGGEGPAVVGVLRPQIVLPRWSLGWSDVLQHLIVQHEGEHVRAGDTRLLLAAAAAVAAMPWNPALWWQLRRLRLAVEVDCDARVLAAGARVDEYGELLLRVGRLASGGALPMLTLARPRSFLERRIRAMTHRTPRSRALTLAAAAAGCIALTAAARAVPRPPRPELALPAVPAAAPSPDRVSARGDTVRPVLVNAAQVQRSVAANYPPLLRHAGVSGQALLALHVDAAGRVTSSRVVSATHPQFGQAARRVASVMRFRPQRVAGRAVPADVRLPFGFTLDEPKAATPHDGVAFDLRDVDTQPRLANPLEVKAAIAQAYPPRLRDAGVGGTARVRLLVTAAGAVERAESVGASQPAFAVGAVRAVRAARFQPARKAGRAVPVWLVLPVAFSVRG